MISRIVSVLIVILIGTFLLDDVAAVVKHTKNFPELPEKILDKKQTYKEYVQERLEIERMMRC